MNDAQRLRDIYRHTVLDHSRHPRNFKRLKRADRTICGHNPLCGDKLTVYIQLAGEKITDITFEGTGCAISLASASIMTESLARASVHDAQKRVAEIMESFTASPEP